MEKNKKNKNIVGIIAFITAILLLVVLLVWNTLKEDDNQSKVSYEAEQLELFTGGITSSKEFQDWTKKTQSGEYSLDEAQYNFNNLFSKEYSNLMDSGKSSVAVDSLYSNLKTTTNGATTKDDLLSSITELLDIDIMGFVTGLLGGSSSESTMQLSLKSNTVCQSVKDSKFCIDNLSANVYVKDEKITNWAVVVHPFMTSGSLMYNSVGTFYTEAGYNVLAPDLRGFGNSGGSVAMGYLESLDIYDWIKDLNENYTRYGVNSAPTNIIVHGVSLGGATTLQLATNPDIASAKGGAYTKNLTQLHVNGFVDDCGYTSMSGIITGMFSALDISSLTSSLGSLGIDLESFMTEIQTLLNRLGISGFETLDLDSLFNADGSIMSGKFNEVLEIMESFAGVGSAFDAIASGDNSTIKDVTGMLSGTDTNALESMFGNIIPSDYLNKIQSNLDKYKPSENTNTSGNTTSNWQDYYENLKDKYQNKIPGDYEIPTVPSLFPQIQSDTTGNTQATLINKSMFGSGDFLDGLISTVLINLIGVGLTEDNYAYYSDSFAEGRRFPSGSNVMIIHGTSDTTVPHSNADTVAANIPSDVKLFKKWDAEGMPHAFVIIGSEKDNYSKAVNDFANLCKK